MSSGFSVDWSTYAGSLVEFQLPAGHAATLIPAPVGERFGELPAQCVHVLTAYNPGQLLSEQDNQLLQERLSEAVVRRGWSAWPATGRSADGEHQEPSLAVPDVDLADVLDVAREYRQLAVFQWTQASWSVVSSEGSVVAERGFRITESS